MTRKPIKIKEIWTDYVICMECGNKYKQINSHLVHTHNMTSQEYKDKYPGFPLQCGKIANQCKGENNPNYSSGKRYAKKKRLEENIKNGTEGVDFVTCMECGEQVRMLTTTGHLARHKMTRKQYVEKHPKALLTCTDFSKNTCHLSTLSFEERSEFAVKNIQTTRTFTIPHQRVNQMLDELGVSYQNEQIILNRNIDIQIDDTHFIEVQGDYWHCNPTKFELPKDHNQERKIGLDTIKSNIFKRSKLHILYLWEQDILDKPGMCKILIEKYLRNRIKNFHSFNYTDKGTLRKDIIQFYYG